MATIAEITALFDTKLDQKLQPVQDSVTALQAQVNGLYMKRQRPAHLLDHKDVKWRKEGAKREYEHCSNVWDNHDKLDSQAEDLAAGDAKDKVLASILEGSGVFPGLNAVGREKPWLRGLVSRIPSTILKAQANSTVVKYSKAFQLALDWMKKNFGSCSLPFPMLPTVVFLQWIIDTSKSKQRYFKFLYGIRWAHHKAGLPSPTDSIIIKEMTLAAKRILGRPVVKKKPVKSFLLDEIYTVNQKDLRANPETIRNCAIPNLCNRGFLRISELVNVQRKHIKISNDFIEIFIPIRKNDPESEGHTIFLAKSNSISCPYKVVEHLLSIIPVSPDAFLLFSFSPKKRILSAGLSVGHARKLFKQVAATVLSELEVKQVSTHSAKRGGIQDADDAGCSGEEIDCHAGYKSDKSKLEYLDKEKKSKEVARKLAKMF